jgi:hypothetical protein
MKDGMQHYVNLVSREGAEKTVIMFIARNSRINKAE